NERFGITADEGVEPIFLAPEAAREGRAILPAVIEGAHVAAGAQCPVASPVEQDELDRGVHPPRLQCRPNLANHAERQRVERLRAVHGEAPGPALATDQHLVSCRYLHGCSLDNRSQLGISHRIAAAQSPPQAEWKTIARP